MKTLKTALFLLILCFVLSGCGSANTEETTTETTETTETTASESAKESTPEYTDVSSIKEISSPMGFGMNVDSVVLTPEGDVILRAKAELAESVGWQLIIANDVKNLYVESFNQGNSYIILMIRNDGTVSAVNHSVLTQDNRIEIMDELGGYHDVTSIEAAADSETKTINAVMSSGEKQPLEPYLQ